VNIENLLLRGGVELVNFGSDASADGLVIVVGELVGNTSVLVDLSGLGDNSGGLLVDLARDGLVLANDLVSNSVVQGVEEVEESRRNALFVVKLDSSLDNVVSENVAVGEVLGDDSGSWLVLLADLASGTGDTGSDGGSTRGSSWQDRGLWLGIRSRGDLEVGTVKRTAVQHQRRPHGAELLKGDVGGAASLLDLDKLSAEGEEVVQLLLCRLGGETGDMDGVSWGDGGGSGSHCD